MAQVNTQGLVDDGSANLSVAGNETIVGTSATGANMMVAQTLATTGAVTVPSSGLFFVSASVGFTGSLPSPASWPGADLMIVEALGTNTIMLTGSMAMIAMGPGVVLNSANTLVMSSSNGTRLTLSKGGSIVMASDMAKWVICAVNGTGSLSQFVP